MEHIPILKLKPIFQSKIWGGRRLAQFFPNQIPTGAIGECWLISGHANGDTAIDGGPLDRWPLSRVYQQHRHLFGNHQQDEFPLIIKIIDASDDLSVQVHPDDRYAQKIGQQYGKEEAWLVLEPSNNRKVQLGHLAKTKAEFKQLVNQGAWNELLKYHSIDNNDLIPVKPGTLHAILKGTLILEIQQSSDTTYRVYDYDRLDELGHKRPLHLKEALDVMTIPDVSSPPIKLDCDTTQEVKVLWQGTYFSLIEWNVTTSLQIKVDPDSFLLVTVISGSGIINQQHYQQGDAFIITSQADTLELIGTMRCMVTVPVKQY